MEIVEPDKPLLDHKVKQGRIYLIQEDDPVKKLINRYSTWDRLKRGVAWMIRFKNILSGRAKGECNRKEGLSVAELKGVENYIIWMQRQSFPDIEKKQTVMASKVPGGVLLSRN